MTSALRRHGVGYAFIAPALILITIFLIIPILFVLWISLNKWGILGTPKFVGLANYQFLLGDERFAAAVRNTVYYAVLAVPAQIGLGLFLALLVNKKVPGQSIFRTAFFIPLAISFVAGGILFQWILTTTPLSGFVPNLFGAVGVPFPNWQTTDGPWAMVMIVLMNTWKSAGYCMVIYLAGLQGIHREYIEAAEIDGARSDWAIFRHIQWPLLAPTTFLLVVTTTIFTVRGFEPIFVMTAGGPSGATTTLVYYLYDKFPAQMGVSSAAAAFLLVGVLAITLVQFVINRRRPTYY